jgi:hypothetical protein
MARLPARRVLVAVAVLAVVVAAFAAGWVVRGSDDGSSASPEAVETSASLPSDEQLDHDHEEESHGAEGEHEHDHVDTVDPDVDPADYVAFCEAFYVFARAYSSSVDQLDASGTAPELLVSAAADFRAVADRTEMTDEVRAGLDWFVDDVLRVDNDASPEEQMAWSTFLNSACPA